MGTEVGVIGAIIAIVGAIGTGYNTYSQRRAAKDKMESDLRAARDKMETDRDLQKLKDEHANCHEKAESLNQRLLEINTDLRKCREQHEESERDRKSMWEKLMVFTEKLAGLGVTVKEYKADINNMRNP